MNHHACNPLFELQAITFFHSAYLRSDRVDSAVEEYRFVTPELSPGEHLRGIRAGDRNGTTGTAGVVILIIIGNFVVINVALGVMYESFLEIFG